ncbi:hypothetical protein H2248_012038 [Termitomyces sp. 'cryptogamus']|nr:hypothetical protein H2248_012038 [Termitomyces sp. 'cryptogamus']
MAAVQSHQSRPASYTLFLGAWSTQIPRLAMRSDPAPIPSHVLPPEPPLVRGHQPSGPHPDTRHGSHTYSPGSLPLSTRHHRPGITVRSSRL